QCADTTQFVALADEAVVPGEHAHLTATGLQLPAGLSIKLETERGLLVRDDVGQGRDAIDGLRVVVVVRYRDLEKHQWNLGGPIEILPEADLQIAAYLAPAEQRSEEHTSELQ